MNDLTDLHTVTAVSISPEDPEDLDDKVLRHFEQSMNLLLRYLPVPTAFVAFNLILARTRADGQASVKLRLLLAECIALSTQPGARSAQAIAEQAVDKVFRK